MKISALMRTVVAAAAAISTIPAGALAAESGPSRLLEIAGGKVDTRNTIVLSADVKCPPVESYRLWSTADGAKAFFAPDARVGDALGGEYTMIFFAADDPKGLTHGTAGARVLARDPGRFFAFEWVVFAGDTLKGDNAPPYAPEALRRPSPLPTWVELTFTPAPGDTPSSSGTHVEFRHFGFGDSLLYRQSRTFFTRAWGGVLAQMKAHCEKQS
jgi:uncharacterized protein YndB with AHSA1/START domain